MTSVSVDVAGGPVGGAARFRDEYLGYLRRHERSDVWTIGMERRLNAGWLIRRETACSRKTRRIALNNVGFLAPGGARWTLMGNALHFLTDSEISQADTALRTTTVRQAAVVRLIARRSDVIIAPCSAMANRIEHIMPCIRERIVVRMHPVSPVLKRPPEVSSILCPLFFTPYKHMAERISEWVEALHPHLPPTVQLVVTATPAEVPQRLAAHPRIHFAGRLSHADLHRLWLSSSAVYFPSALESFGYSLAEARANGYPVIALDTPQNREIAGPALYGYTIGDAESLRHATELALKASLDPDPSPFDPDAYFDWMLNAAS